MEKNKAALRNGEIMQAVLYRVTRPDFRHKVSVTLAI